MRAHRTEGIEIHDRKIDGHDPVFGHYRIVRAGTPQERAVNARMQRFHAATHDLGKARVLRHIGDGDAICAQKMSGAAR